MTEKTLLMDEIAVSRAIKRISHEIVERNKGVENIVLVGVVTRGVPFAEKIARSIQEFEDVSLPVGSVDISFYRDDVKRIAPSPVLNGCDIPCDVNDKHIVLCDDVLYTGRTARAAMEAAPKVAEILARELGRDKNWENAQIQEFKNLASGYILND